MVRAESRPLECCLHEATCCCSCRRLLVGEVLASARDADAKGQHKRVFAAQPLKPCATMTRSTLPVFAVLREGQRQSNQTKQAFEGNAARRRLLYSSSAAEKAMHERTLAPALPFPLPFCLTVWLRSNLSSIIRAVMLEWEMLTLTTPSGSRENCSLSAAVTQSFRAAKSAAIFGFWFESLLVQ